jgi:hypothetical protein
MLTLVNSDPLGRKASYRTGEPSVSTHGFTSFLTPKNMALLAFAIDLALENAVTAATS